MPRATKDHRSKKDPQAHESWRRDRVTSDPSKIRLQRWWRTDALQARAQAGTLTDKNRKEIEKLGIRITE